MKFFAAIALCLLLTSNAYAHAVFVDAWVDDGKMCAEGSFAGKTKAKNSTVTVTDPSGNKIHEGRTDEAGQVCFPLPSQAVKLIFTLNAGQGHRAETTLHEDDFPTNASAAAASQPSPAPGAAMETTSAASVPAIASAIPGPDLENAVREAVRHELQKQLGPIRQSLAAIQKKEPGLLEIFGGIGWIVGLTGAAALAASRRRQK